MFEPKNAAGYAVEKNGLHTPPSDAPPTYAVNDSDFATNVTAAFSNLRLDNTSKPSVDQCIAHLKLLEAFHQLREDIALTDGLFGLHDSFAPSTGDERKQAELLTKIREKRWAVYVVKAAKRFERWWDRAVQPDAPRLQQKNLPTAFKAAIHVGQVLAVGRDHLPPLDVMMVWHAYQLNPRDFLEDCLRFGKMDSWRTGLPWAAINSCIENDTFEFTASHGAVDHFERSTGLAWSSLNDAAEAQVKCPMCKQTHSVPWTQWNSKSAWTDDIIGVERKLKGESIAFGLADKKFSFQSPCGTVIDHELLKTQKFRKDMEALRFHDIPMPGTLLNTSGLPEAPSDHRHKPLFPNRMIHGPNNEPSMAYSLLEATTAVRLGINKTMSDVRKDLERSLVARHIRKANQAFIGSITREEKMSIRRMMSHYWDNSSPFALDLVGAVIRQGTFIEKMHSIDWIHFPTLPATMTRLLTKYDRYITILKTWPTHIAVPTLDIDLVWHTHQLSPPAYYAHTVTQTQKFIDHDDKIEETALSTAFEWTSKTYQKMFNEVYSECTCWYCEAIRESHTNSVTRLFSSNASAIDSQVARLHSTGDPHSSPHISAHNAIKAETDKDRKLRERVTQLRLEQNYHAAVRHAKKRGRKPPQRDEYMYTYAYGYPMYMPYYAPYMGDPCTGGMYASNPSCANFQTGAAGNCCQGTCGGAVAAGSCGNGAGSCAGGSAGGCSGGGSGGGCGGGGGGGGGGCGGGGG